MLTDPPKKLRLPSSRRMSMPCHSPSHTAPATRLIKCVRAKPPTGDILAIDRIKASMRVSPTPTLVDARVVFGCRRSGWRSSMSTVATSRKPTVVPVEGNRFEGISTACEGQHRLPTCVLASTGVPCAGHMAKYPTGEFDRANFFGEPSRAMRDVCMPATRPSDCRACFQDFKPVSTWKPCFARYASGELDPKINLSWQGGLAPLSARRDTAMQSPEDTSPEDQAGRRAICPSALA